MSKKEFKLSCQPTAGVSIVAESTEQGRFLSFTNGPTEILLIDEEIVAVERFFDGLTAVLAAQERQNEK